MKSPRRAVPAAPTRDAHKPAALSAVAEVVHLEAQMPDRPPPADLSSTRPAPRITPIRIKEIERILSRRHGGGPLPNNDRARSDFATLLDHLATLANGVDELMEAAFGRWVPWMQAAQRSDLKQQAVRMSPTFWTADELGTELRVTIAERAEWRLKTIGAVGFDKDARAEDRKQKKRDREKERRRRKRQQFKPPPSTWARTVAVLDLLPGNAEIPVSRLRQKLAGSEAFSGTSLREAVHRAIKTLEEKGAVVTRIAAARPGRLPSLWVRRTNERDVPPPAAGYPMKPDPRRPTNRDQYRRYLKEWVFGFGSDVPGLSAWYRSADETLLREQCGIPPGDAVDAEFWRTVDDLQRKLAAGSK